MNLADPALYQVKKAFAIVLVLWSASIFAHDANESKRIVRVDSAAVEVRELQKQSLANFLADSDYLYDREPPPTMSLWASVRYWLLRRMAELFSSRAGLTFWRIFPYLFVAGVMVFAIMQLLKARFGNVFYRTPTAAHSGAVHERIESIHATSFDQLLADAIAAQQYRLAVRYLFLKTLQQLSQKGHLTWKAEKTNHEYLRELRDAAWRPLFQELVAWFEHVWYGNFPVSEATFARIHFVFGQFARMHAD